MGCVAAAPPTRIEGRLRHVGLTRHEASNTQHVQSSRARGAQQRHAAIRRRLNRGPEPAREARARPSGGGDSNRLYEVNSHLTHSRYQHEFI